MSEPGTEDALSFEGAMERLEDLVEQMESAQLPLAELITRYEEGNRLLQVCSRQLEAAEQRVQIILKSRGGKPQLAEFDETKAPEAPASRAPSSQDLAPANRPSPRAEPKTSPRVVDDSDEEISLF